MYTVRKEETMREKCRTGEEEVADGRDVLRVQIKIDTNMRRG